MNKYLILMFLIIPHLSEARDFKVIELDEIRVDYINYLPGGRDPSLTNGTGKELGSLLDVNVHTTQRKDSLFKF